MKRAASLPNVVALVISLNFLAVIKVGTTVHAATRWRRTIRGTIPPNFLTQAARRW